MKRFMLGFVALSCASSLAAQEVGPALDPGQLTGTLAQDHVRWSEARRADNSATRSARQASACSNLPSFRRQYGASHPKVVRLAKLCRKAGY